MRSAPIRTCTFTTLASGQTRNLTEGMPGYDKYPVFSPDDSMLAFTSMERAGNESDKSRLFVETLATGEKRYLTRNFDYNAGNVRWDGNGTLYFIAPVREPIRCAGSTWRTIRCAC